METPRDAVVAALRQLRRQVRWRPGKARQHFAKRVALGHLPPEAPVAAYEALIQTIVHTPTAEVWIYRWGVRAYPTVVAAIDEVLWLVMLGMDGIMETAFPPADPRTYLGDPRFARLGTLAELGV